MERRSRVHLDHPNVRGRIREPQSRHAIAKQQTDIHAHSQSVLNSKAQLIQPVQPRQAVKPRQTDQLPAKTQPVPLTATERTQTASLRRIRTESLPVRHGEKAHLPRQARSGVLRRQMVRSSSKKFRAKKHRSFKPYLVAGLASFIVLAGSLGIFIAVKKYQSSSATTGVLAKQSTVANTDTGDGTSGNDMPSEDNPPADISNYTVGADMPRFLVIDKLGVNARVRRVGADVNNAIKGPSNIFDAGWYENSSEPGEGGTVVIDGHVSGESKRGIFYGLNTLKKGDKVIVERGDGERISYTVVTSEQAEFENLDMKKLMTSNVPGKVGLNLMTATGRFNVRTNQYEKRIIVYTVQD